MSSRTSKVLYAHLLWAEYLLILQHLTLSDLRRLGLCCRDGYRAYLREKNFRQTPLCKLPRGRFLGRSYSHHEKVLVVSYPRSGNSLMRSILETDTGIITGSDSRTNRTLSAALLRCGFAGEGVVDDSVWIVKSHYPERMGYISFPTRRVILVVRNVFDSMESYFHMGMTNTHDKRLSDPSLQRLKDEGLWDSFIKNECVVWSDFHKHWVSLAVAAKVHLHIVRYEDLLCERRAKVVRGAMSFLTTESHAAPPPRLLKYNPASTSSGATPECGAGYDPKPGSVGRALRLLSREQVQQVLDRCRFFLSHFGYSVVEGGSLHVIPDTDLNPGQASHGEVEGVRVNASDSVRGPDDRFGRRMTHVRRGLTADDTAPFQMG